MLERLKELDGYYECHRDADGMRVGRLVVYAGTYKADDGTEHSYVGDVYANFARLERKPDEFWYSAKQLAYKLPSTNSVVMCGMPMGGLMLATALAHITGSSYMCLEKKVVELATPFRREKAKLVFGRYEALPGMSAILGEDVCNNFSTTGEAIDVFTVAGMKVLAIACLLNRSEHHQTHFPYKGVDYPVISLVAQPFPEYRQDDPRVAEDIKRVGVCIKPKDSQEWAKLQASMRQ